MSIERLQDMINQHQRIVFLGGAGVSTESGIPDFRSADGIYAEGHSVPPETILSYTFFHNHPDKFYSFYRSKMLHTQAKPNPAHCKLAEMEQSKKLHAVITQNIDGLHQAAGSERVLELHGSVYRNYCMICHTPYTIEYIMQNEDLPICTCGGMIRPDVTLYEEPLDQDVLLDAVLAVQKADMMIVGGTSLNVYPAAGLIDYFEGDSLVLINKSTTPYDELANLVIHDPIGSTLEKIKI